MKIELAFLKTLARAKKVYYGGQAYDFPAADALERLKDKDPRGQLIWKVAPVTASAAAPAVIPERKVEAPAAPARQEDDGIVRLPKSMKGATRKKAAAIVSEDGDSAAGVTADAAPAIPANALIVDDETDGGVAV